MKRFVNSGVPKAMLIGLFMAVLLFLAAPAAGQAAPVEPEVFRQIEAHGEATFWVMLKEQADLSAAYGIANWEERGKHVVDQLQAVAERTQPAVIAQLEAHKASYKSFWIVNAIQVTGDERALNDLANHPSVAQILADRVYEIPEPIPASDEPRINVVEWGIDRINAPQVWTDFGVRGEGIVVGSIDTGVLFDHAALVEQYRGNLGSGVFDHNYNWFDPSNVCGNPSLAPCDNNGHGSHVTGTMVGDDGGSNQIGVAPAARWISAKGCETSSCSQSALLASGQWILAPTDLNGENPRPDLRPHVINNSWGGGATTDPWYQATVQAWVAAGIFPQFANGNNIPGCTAASNPGNLVESYAAGAFDINNNIAGFSNRGPSAWDSDLIKPNISAPGVSIRSAWNNGSYSTISGTSMASPHVAGTVALIWSAAPSVMGNIDATRALLDQTAIDVSDLSCGGTPENNNVWGEGRLDAFAAVSQAPIGDTGALEGTVTDAETGDPVPQATVMATGPVDRTTMTDNDGFYSFPVLSIGSYDVTASKFGYISETATGVEVETDATTVQDFALQPAPAGSLSGTVSDNRGEPVANATVTILGTPIPPVTTDENGFYSFASVPEGTYDVRAEAGGCNDPLTLSVTVSGNTSQDFVLPARSDAFGYYCVLEEPNYVEGDTPLGLTGDDAFLAVPLPFPFIFYGETHDTAFVCTNGYLNFLAGNCTFSNTAIPNTAAPNGAIYPYWDDLVMDTSSSMWTMLDGEAPNRSFLIEWRNARYFGDTTRRIDFTVTLHENGQIETQYRNIDDDGRERGNSATLGIENQAGTVALQYSFNEAVLNVGEMAIRYRLPPSGFVQGTVTDFNDSLPIAGVTVRALEDGSIIRQTSTDANGFYRVQVPVGEYTIEASMTNYATASADVAVEEDETVVQDFALETARIEVSPVSLELVIPAGEMRTRYLTLANSGTLPGTWELNESGGGRVQVSGSAANLVPNPDYDPDSATTEGQYLEGTPPSWAPTAPGDIIRSWLPTGLALAWGVGYDGNVWLSDVPTSNRNHEFTVDGAATGRSYPAPWAGSWPGDMSPSSAADEVCQVNVGGDNGIYCWNKNTGDVTRSITGPFPWTTTSQRGLAYRPDDDTFYIGGWNQNILYQVAGFSHGTPGQVVHQCSFAGTGISGLGWNPAAQVVWMATNSATDAIYQVNPETCTIVGSLAHPRPGFNGGGLEMDDAGDLWMIEQLSAGGENRVYLMESGVPAFTDVPWLDANPTSGALNPGESEQVEVVVDTTGLEPGVYAATLHFSTNSGRQPNLAVPVLLIVPKYQTLLNAGGPMYVDGSEDTWVADQAYAADSWGYTNHSSRPGSTRRAIGGTDDQPLYQTMRQDPQEYRFDGLPDGVYEVRLRFAEVSNTRPGVRVFDVIVEGDFFLPAYDIAAAVGSFYADEYVFYVPVTDGQLNIEIVARRGYAPPHINAIGVTERPDQ